MCRKWKPPKLWQNNEILEHESILVLKSIGLIFLYYFSCCAAVKCKCAFLLNTLYRNVWKNEIILSSIMNSKSKSKSNFFDAFHTIIFFSKLDITQCILFFYMLLIIFCSNKKKQISQFSHWSKWKKKLHKMNLFLESFIFAIYVEYNLATKSKLDFINSFIFLSLIELIRKQKQKTNTYTHIPNLICKTIISILYM